MTRKCYRVVSGTMRVLTRATGYRIAIRKARSYRNWSDLGILTKFQTRFKGGEWGPWHYVKTDL